MNATPVAEPATAQGRLGEWTANLVRLGRQSFVIAVSEPTRIGLVIEAAPYRTLTERFLGDLSLLLFDLGVAGDLIEDELLRMRPVEVATSNSKSVLGTINEFALHIEWAFRDGSAVTARGMTRHLSKMIVCKPANVGFPANRVREAFGLPLLQHVFSKHLTDPVL